MKEEMSKAVTFLKDYLEQNRSFKSFQYHNIPLDFFPKSTKTFLTYKTRDRQNTQNEILSKACIFLMMVNTLIFREILYKKSQ
jgi:hypothetical protein